MFMIKNSCFLSSIQTIIFYSLVEEPRSCGEDDGKDCILARERLSSPQRKSESETEVSQELNSKNNISNFQHVDSFTEIDVTNVR